MNFRPLLNAALLMGTLLFSSCSVFEPGSPAAANTVQADSIYQVYEAITNVFNSEGYKVSERDAGSITLDKSADGTDRLLYGNWGGDDVVQRVKINVKSQGEGKFRLRLQPSAVRHAGSVAFEDDTRKMQLFSVKYGRMLGAVKKLLKEGMLEEEAPVQ